MTMPEIPLKWGFCLGPEEKTAFCQMLDKVADSLPEGETLTYYEIGIGNADTMLAVHSWLTQRSTPHTIVGVDLPGYHGGALNYNFNEQPSASFGSISLALVGSEAFLSNVSQKADFIFIDACHGSPCATRDFLLAEKKIKPGGIIAFHDTDPNCQGHHFQDHCQMGIDVRKAVQELGLLDDTRPGWRKVGETAGKFPEYHGCLFVQRDGSVGSLNKDTLKSLYDKCDEVSKSVLN